jgi:2-methylcitrate dehydratase PrpD
MMAKGDVTLHDYTEEGLRDPRVLAMADKVSYRPAAQPPGGRGGSADVSKTSLEIVTKDGRVLTHRPDGVPGDPKYPVGWERLEAKFRDCVSFSARPVAAGNIDRAAELIRNLEKSPNVTQVIGLLA